MHFVHIVDTVGVVDTVRAVDAVGIVDTVAGMTLLIFMRLDMISMGTGKMMVLLCSAEILFRVWR